jgi:hypothetical protein
VHPGPEKLVRHRSADKRGGDIIEEGREHPDENKKGESAFPFRGQKLWQDDRHVAFLEVARQKREASQETKEIEQNDPFVFEMEKEPGRARPGLKAG